MQHGQGKWFEASALRCLSLSTLYLFVTVSSLDHVFFFLLTRCLRISSMSNEQVDPKFMRNQRYAKHGSERALREARAAAQSA